MKLTIKKVAKPEMGKVRGVITCGCCKFFDLLF